MVCFVFTGGTPVPLPGLSTRASENEGRPIFSGEQVVGFLIAGTDLLVRIECQISVKTAGSIRQVNQGTGIMAFLYVPLVDGIIPFP